MVDVTHSHTPTDSAPRHARRGLRVTRLLLRVVATVAAADSVVQAMLAGQFLGGSYDALLSHERNSTILALLTLLVFILTFVHKWLARGSWREPLLTFGIVVAMVIQFQVANRAGVALHVPLGAGLLAALVGVATWTWRLRLPDTGAR